MTKGNEDDGEGVVLRGGQKEEKKKKRRKRKMEGGIRNLILHQQSKLVVI